MGTKPKEIRLIDVQMEDIGSLKKLNKNITKESQDRRKSVSILTSYEEKRDDLWTKINNQHKILMAQIPPPPEDYVAEYNKAAQYNEELKRTLETFFMAVGKDYTPINSAIATATEQKSPEQERATATENITPAPTTAVRINIPTPNTPAPPVLINLATPTIESTTARSAIYDLGSSMQATTSNWPKELENNPAESNAVIADTVSKTTHNLTPQLNQHNEKKNDQTNSTDWNEIMEQENMVQDQFKKIQNQMQQQMSAFQQNLMTQLAAMLPASQNTTTIAPTLPEKTSERVNKNSAIVHNQAEEFVASINTLIQTQTATKIDSTAKIIPFSGELLDYIQFKETFMKVMENKSDSDKMLELRFKTKGEAHALISGLHTDGASYTKAWQILDSHFASRKKHLAHNLSRLWDKQLDTKANDLRSLIKLSSTIMTTISNINQLQVSAEEVAISLALMRLDEKTQRRFQLYRQSPADPVTAAEFSDFVQSETCNHDISITNSLKINEHKTINKLNQKRRENSTLATIQSVQGGATSMRAACKICGLEGHQNRQCAKFLAAENRIELLKSLKLCIYCASHVWKPFQPCRKRARGELKCDTCGQDAHITELHPNNQQSLVSINDKKNVQTILFQTAIARLEDITGQKHPIRLLIDEASTASYVTKELQLAMKLKTRKVQANVSGINQDKQLKVHEEAALILYGRNNEKIEVKALIVPSIIKYLPITKVYKPNWLQSYVLADEKFNIQAGISLMLGSDVISKIAANGTQIIRQGLVLRPTVFGYTICGSAPVSKKEKALLTTNGNGQHQTLMTLMGSDDEFEADNLAQKIEKFYMFPEDEDQNSPGKTIEVENEYCEQLFLEKHYRNADGRYVVPIPWKHNKPELGDSCRKAIRFFLCQEKKWLKNPILHDKSNSFMREYQELGHMEEIIAEAEKFKDGGDAHTLTYLTILKEDSLSTRVRNVFNGSLPTSNGISLNDTMYEGPNLLNEIPHIMTKARTFKYVISADIEKMFRQIFLRPEDYEFLRIVHRSSPQEPLKEYRLRTVTYGTDAAPYLANRTMHQCAMDNAPTKEIEQIIKTSFYMDDLYTGADEISEAQQLIAQIGSTLEKGCFPLTKWSSNSKEVLAGVPEEKRLSHYQTAENSKSKILGIIYDNEVDDYSINTKIPERLIYTKRGALSFAASIYDVLGFALPYTMMYRLFVQTLWKKKYDWDDDMDEEDKIQFDKLTADHHLLSELKINRWFFTHQSQSVELIGFSDASGKAKAAVIYCRTKHLNEYKITMIMAKGNVNKINTPAVSSSNQNTIVKNELDALYMLAQLFQKVLPAFLHLKTTIRAYCDNKPVLYWVRSPNRLKIKFIDRRVQLIKAVIGAEDVHHVKSADNPADIASRGCMLPQLLASNLWLKGAPWLTDEELPSTTLETDDQNMQTFITHSKQKDEPSNEKEDIFKKTSSWIRLIRAVSFMRRWINYKKPKNLTAPITSPYNYDAHAPLTAEEVSTARIKILQYYQRLSLAPEIIQIMKGQAPRKGHWLHRLTPFIDEAGTLRVGGRLENALIPYEQKHKIILPKCRLTKLLIEYTHKKSLHAGESKVLQMLIGEYYLPAAKSAIHSVINKCQVCIRFRGQTIQQQMGQLPRARVEPSGLFQRVGTDLCGPFTIKASSLRTVKTMKVWIVVFICLAFKAAHLEVITSLSTQEFLAALTRVSCRRGTISEIWSDNGTNFKGAARELKEAWNKIIHEGTNLLASKEISWRFIPAYAPNFGGIWESCVAALKHFTKRIFATDNMTYEQFCTLVCQIEAILNSRPLIPNPIDPTEDMAITPFHLISQRAYSVLPTNVSETTGSSLTKKYRTIMTYTNKFKEIFISLYLAQLQKMHKWTKPQRNLNGKEIVLIKEPNIKPAWWKIAEVTEVYPDKIGLVRQVKVRTSDNKYKQQAVSNLVLLREPQEMETEIDNQPSELPLTQPRRSERIRNKNDALITISSWEVPNMPNIRNKISAKQILKCWLTVATLATALQNTQAQPVTKLSPGIHLYDLGLVDIKATDLHFACTLPLNITENKITINSAIEQYKQLCQDHESTPDISNYCLNLHQNLQMVATEILNAIENSYQPRQKRQLVTLGKFAWKAVKKYGFEIAATSALVYEANELHNAKNEIDRAQQEIMTTEQKLIQASAALAQMQITSNEKLNSKLKNIVDIQRIKELEASFYTHYLAIVRLLDQIKNKHEEVMTQQPEKEIKEFLNDMNKILKEVKIPTNISLILTYVKRSKTLINGQAVLKMEIPVPQINSVHKYVIINTPNEENKAMDLHFNNSISEIFVDQNMTAMYQLKSTITDTFIEVTEPETLEKCTAQILTKKKIDSSCKIPMLERKYTEAKILNDTLLILSIGSQDENSKITCFNQQWNLIASQSYEIDFKNCSFASKQQKIYSSALTTEMKHVSMATELELINDPPPIKLPNIQPDTELEIMQSQLMHNLQLPGMPNAVTNTNVTYIGGVTFIVITIIIITRLIADRCLRCMRKTKKDRKSFPDWQSPIVLNHVITIPEQHNT